MQRSHSCPLCKTQWDGKSYVGEQAITTSESYRKGRRRTTQGDTEDVEDGEQEGA